MYITNAFSLNMLTEFPCSIHTKEISRDEAIRFAELGTSAIGHADTAAVFSDVLETVLPANRITLSIAKDESLLVGQYVGPRLPEGATELPEGAAIKWLLVKVQ
jgi:hypothetical protein